MSGLTLKESTSLFELDEGVLDGSLFPKTSFELVYYSELEVSHDLFIVETNDSYEYRLLITYLDGINLPVYEGEERLFHRFMTVVTKPDGTYSGDIVYIDEKKKGDEIHVISPSN
jgi:hypothetical protein